MAKQVTVYMRASFGGMTAYGTLCEIAGTWVEYVPQGKRKPVRSGNANMVVLAGIFPPVWDGRDGDSSRWEPFDPRYADHYNMEVDKVIAENPDAVLLDIRVDARTLG